jgi:hypothetical protein
VGHAKMVYLIFIFMEVIMKRLLVVLLVIFGLQVDIFAAGRTRGSLKRGASGNNGDENPDRKPMRPNDDSGGASGGGSGSGSAVAVAAPVPVELENCVICFEQLDPANPGASPGSRIVALHERSDGSSCKFHARCINTSFHSFRDTQLKHKLQNAGYVIPPFRCIKCQQELTPDKTEQFYRTGYPLLMHSVILNNQQQQRTIVDCLNVMQLHPPKSVLLPQGIKTLITTATGRASIPDYINILHFIADLTEERTEAFNIVIRSLQPNPADATETEVAIREFIRFLHPGLQTAAKRGHTNIIRLSLEAIRNCYLTPDAQQTAIQDCLQIEDHRHDRVIEFALEGDRLEEFLDIVQEVCGNQVVLACLSTRNSQGLTALHAAIARKKTAPVILQKIWNLTDGDDTEKKAALLAYLQIERPDNNENAMLAALHNKRVLDALLTDIIDISSDVLFDCFHTRNSQGLTVLHAAIAMNFADPAHPYADENDLNLGDSIFEAFGNLVNELFEEEDNGALKKSAIVNLLQIQNNSNQSAIYMAIEHGNLEKLFNYIKPYFHDNTEIIQEILFANNIHNPLLYAHINHKTAAIDTILKTIIDITPGGIVEKMAALNRYVTSCNIPPAGPAGAPGTGDE